MSSKSETPFTARMREICEQATQRCPGYYPSRFHQMINDCGGDFVPTAKRLLLSGSIQKGLWTLAKNNALDVSMESVICQAPWRELFSRDEVDAAQWRLGEAARRVSVGEKYDSDEY